MKPENCQDHQDKFLEYYCFDPHCKKTSFGCVICIKNEHKSCKDELIVDKSEAQNKVVILEKQVDPKTITNKLNQILELKIFEMNKSLMNKKKAFIASFNIDQNPENIFEGEILNNIKKNFNLDYNKETKKVQISSKFNVEEELVNESVGTFEKSLEKKILNFLDEFQRLKFYIKGSLNIDQFIGHPNIELSEAENGIQLKRKPEDQSFNYFTVLYTEPLVSKTIFKVHVESIYESDRFVDVGIMPKSKFESTKNGFINSYNSGGISYCGYSICGGISGTYPTTTASSPSGLKPGDHFYLEYDPQVIIKFYNDSQTVNLSLDMTTKTEEYYMFMVVYHPQTKYVIEKIE